jgi:HAD superfamily hydrolase (TIGR01549 family)
MNYSHIIFDIDGTMLDTENAVLISLQDTLKEIENSNYDLNELRFVLGIPGITALNKLNLKNAEHAYFIWNEHLKKHLDAVVLFPGIEELVINLKQKGVNLGIITSKNRFEFNQDFVPFGLADFFKTVICMEDSERPKPSADPMLAYLKKTGISSKEALYIGDTAYDRQCANAAGVDFGLALWGYNAPEKIQAEYYFDKPEEVWNRLEVQRFRGLKV